MGGDGCHYCHHLDLLLSFTLYFFVMHLPFVLNNGERSLKLAVYVNKMTQKVVHGFKSSFWVN